MWECGVTLNTTARRPHHEPVLVLFEHFIRTAAAVGLFFSLFFSFPQWRAAVATHSLYKTRAAADSRKNINSRSTFVERKIVPDSQFFSFSLSLGFFTVVFTNCSFLRNEESVVAIVDYRGQFSLVSGDRRADKKISPLFGLSI